VSSSSHARLAGRVLLEWTLHEETVAGFRALEHECANEGDTAPGDIVEIGSGCGTTAVGLGLTERERRNHSQGAEGSSGRKIFATDCCRKGISNLNVHLVPATSQFRSGK